MLQQFDDVPSSTTAMHSKLTLTHAIKTTLDSPLFLQCMARQPANSFDRWATSNSRGHVHTAHTAQ